MFIFKNINDHKNYTIEHMIVDLRFANCGENCGIYAYPYMHHGKGEIIHFKSKDIEECAQFVIDNFEIIAER